MAIYRITTPAPGHTGMVGNVQFTDGVAVVDSDEHPGEHAYFVAQGYVVEPHEADGETAEETADEAPVVADVDGDGIPEELPKRSASTGAWREFAVAHGMTQDEAAGLSRDELVARYSKEEVK